MDGRGAEEGRRKGGGTEIGRNVLFGTPIAAWIRKLRVDSPELRVSHTAGHSADLCLRTRKTMHVHASQPNPNIQLNALYAAEKAEAKRETERTRKKLMQFASVLSGEAGEACVVKLGAHDGSE